MPKLTRVCACGKTFTTYPAVDKRHCSRECSSRFVPRKRRTGETVACEQCGTSFYRGPTVARQGVGRYCSVACHNAAQTKTPVIKSCAHCGTELRLKPSQARVQYCSKACEAAARVRRPLARQHNGKPARLNDQGYVMVWEPEHPNRAHKGWQPEHRLIAERTLGRFLDSSEHVHHVNGVKDDNRPENLAVMDATEHRALSLSDYHAWLRGELAELAEYRRRFGPLKEG